MPFVTPTQLTALRSVAYRGLDSSATIERSVEVENAFGSAPQWTTVATGVPCWVRAMPLASNIIDVAYRAAVIGAFRIHFEVDADVIHGDRITVGDEQFEVIDVNVENTIQIFRTAVAKRIE